MGCGMIEKYKKIKWIRKRFSHARKQKNGKNKRSELEEELIQNDETKNSIVEKLTNIQVDEK